MSLEILGSVSDTAVVSLPAVAACPAANAAQEHHQEGEKARMTEGPGQDPQRVAECAIWDGIFAKPDPWNYHSQYELEKYRRTLSLFPPQHIEDALELGCAEGIFTEMMAGLAERVLAVDISNVAMERARQRCERFPNVRFEWCDISGPLPSGEFDLIVCSEILYYLQDRYALQDFARRVCRLLRPDGSLLATHANVVSDDPDATGFDFAQIGAKFIGEIFAREPSLEFSCELRTPLYRVQRFRKVQAARRTWGDRGTAAMEVVEKDATFDHPMLKIGGCTVVDSEARHCYRTSRIPILMYHRIATHGPLGLAPYRVMPEMFARQMQFLHRHGYYTVSVDQASRSYGPSAEGPWPGRLVALTFDDGYRDFLDAAWPILRRHGFSATVYLPTDFVGGHADWDACYGAPAPLLSWEEVRQLSEEGVRFGAHSGSHQRLTDLDRTQWSGELNRCRNAIGSATGQPVTSFCYPYGDHDPDLYRAVADAGYGHAVAASLTDGTDRFALPRIDVPGACSLDQFVAALPQPELASEADRLNYRRLRAIKDRRLYVV